jgi:hypothetical protein
MRCQILLRCQLISTSNVVYIIQHSLRRYGCRFNDRRWLSTTEDIDSTTEDADSTTEEARSKTEDARSTPRTVDSGSTTEDADSTTEEARSTTEEARSTTEDAHSTTILIGRLPGEMTWMSDQDSIVAA